MDYWAGLNDTTMGAYTPLPDSDGIETTFSVSADGSIAHYVTDGESHGWAPDYGDAIWPTSQDLDVSGLIIEFFEDYGL